MNTRKLINSCAFDLPVCFPVPITGLELLSDLLPFYISLPCYITSTLPFYKSNKFYFVIRECYSFLSAKFHLRHLYHAKVTILFVAEIFLFTLRKAYFRTKPCR